MDTNRPFLTQVLPTSTQIARARRRLHVKAVALASLTVTGYLMTVAGGWGPGWRLVGMVLLVHGCLGLATGVMHDANHGAFSTRKGVNQALSWTADLLGASSMLWRQQHNVYHHRSTNIDGADPDIDQAPFARLAHTQQWHPIHRWQHLYMWPLYGMLVLRWLTVSDLQATVTGRFGALPLVRRPARRDVVAMFAGKAAHVGWALVLPMMFHPVWVVVVAYVACSWVFGLALALIFQLAHCVDVAAFPAGETPTGDEAAAHQLATTVDIDSTARTPWRWYLDLFAGGLDHQVEHHLAPRLPHTVYRTMSVQVDEVCERFGLARLRHRSFAAAVRSHARWLKTMGARPSAT